MSTRSSRSGADITPEEKQLIRMGSDIARLLGGDIAFVMKSKPRVDL
jgi:hypothetical protein